ncbi:MAG: nitroreductase [Desulfobacteraceae bacterium]|nr:MAG: nitroreductase [Desulfobacteraceae bacterium]
MELFQAITGRNSTRAFLDQPVEQALLEKLLELALRAPSAINLQPWELFVVTGEEKKRLSRVLVKRLKERNVSCGPGAKSPLPAHFTIRQKELLKTMLPGLPVGVSIQDFVNEGSCHFYGAPAAVIVCIDQAFGPIRYADIGILTGYLLLAAQGLGLGSCPIGLVTEFEEEIREQLNIPENKKVIIAIAVGYRDPLAPINQPRSNRAPLQTMVKWRG